MLDGLNKHSSDIAQQDVEYVYSLDNGGIGSQYPSTLVFRLAERLHPATLQNVFIVWYLLKHRNNFTFISSKCTMCTKIQPYIFMYESLMTPSHWMH